MQLELYECKINLDVDFHMFMVNISRKSHYARL